MIDLIEFGLIKTAGSINRKLKLIKEGRALYRNVKELLKK